MKLYIDLKQLITYLFFLVAILIILASLVFSNRLVKELEHEERNKIEIWAEATMLLASGNEHSDMNLVLNILQSNTTIPVILYDVVSDSYVANNIKLPSKNQNEYLRSKAEVFSKRHEPVELDDLNQYLYYDDSYTLKQLSMFPYIQISIILVFITLAFFALRSSLQSEQNRVWMGLSKETAHQLGTPISSIAAWLELIKLKGADEKLIDEVEKDVNRLKIIADRFSKIGSKSDFIYSDLRAVIDRSLEYMEKRVSKRILFKTSFPENDLLVAINEPLFEWVIENLIKNAVDAMDGEGAIYINLRTNEKKIVLDIIDSGKGIPKSKYRDVFKPGFTTKKRGWGLGLSLVKRIVENYHKGKIFVAKSDIGQGTTFRIILDKAEG